ncbi:hypothetical protein DFH09DRAFT_958682, partial [Mycena vulgaris]
LLLDEVWNAYNQLRRYALGESQARAHCNQHLTKSASLKLAAFKRFLDEALAATRSPQNIAHPTEWQRLMLSDMYRFCPFRELAPSRRRAASALGPYTSEFAATTSGFLSAMIFRAITFNTDFFRSARLRYADHVDFADVMAQSTAVYKKGNNRNPPSTFFCDTRAYGPPNHGRTVKLAETYGPLVKTQNIGTQLALARKLGKPNISFVTFWKWLKGTVNGRVRFSNLGPLGSYLLAADYTYTNPRLIEPPTIDELANLICSLNKGAVTGLERLSLIPPRPLNEKGDPLHSTPDACIRGLKIVHSALCSHWPSEVRREVRFDLVMIEHALCKFARATSLGKFTV